MQTMIPQHTVWFHKFSLDRIGYRFQNVNKLKLTFNVNYKYEEAVHEENLFDRTAETGDP